MDNTEVGLYTGYFSSDGLGYQFNPNWPTGKFIQLLESQGDIVALDDMGGVWFFDYRKGWSQANPNRIPFISTEDENNDED